ncbi:MAG: hypothetical protein ACTSRE_13470 [Promethearchaeota archaeon]
MKSKQIQCFGCSVLCDDIYVEFEDDGSLKTTINSCFRGNSFIKSYLSENRLSQSVQKQMGLEMFLGNDETISFLEKEISEANSINFYGMGTISYQDQLQVLLKIKEIIDKKKTVSIDGLNNSSEFLLLPSLSTIGQGINNVDVFIFWNTDPTHSHPKLFGKLLFSRGMFRLSGKEMKKFILIQKEDSDLTRLKDILLDISNQNSSQFIKEFEKLLDGKPLEEVSLGNLSIENLRTLKTFLQATEYGLIVGATPLSDQISISEFSDFLQKLNSFVKGRFAYMPLTSLTNEIGLYSAVTKIFGKDDKIFQSKLKPADLAIVFGGEYLRDEYNPKEFEYPEKKVILFDNFKSNYSKNAIITIPYAIPGIECDGCATRLDGINVDLLKWNFPEEDVKTIKEIFDRISL